MCRRAERQTTEGVEQLGRCSLKDALKLRCVCTPLLV